MRAADMAAKIAGQRGNQLMLHAIGIADSHSSVRDKLVVLFTTNDLFAQPYSAIAAETTKKDHDTAAILLTHFFHSKACDVAFQEVAFALLDDEEAANGAWRFPVLFAILARGALGTAHVCQRLAAERRWPGLLIKYKHRLILLVHHAHLRQALIDFIDDVQAQQTARAAPAAPNAHHHRPAAAPPQGARQEQFDPTFRTTVVDPTFAELIADQPRLRAVHVDGPLDSFERHLDTVFHAARADALLPLRSTIAWLRAGSPNNETKPHRPTSYQGVHVTGVDASMQGSTVTVFSPSLKQLYERSKTQKGEFAADRVFRNRIKPGNLVAVSFDNFASHAKVYIGTIAPTDFRDLRRGAFAILLTSAGIDTLPPADFTELLTSTVTIVESPVYWEAARHALRTVQQLREREIPLFPLLRGVPQRGALQQLPWRSFDEYQHDEPEFVAGLTLDNTQQLAMHMIFSSSAPIVQGPPGTGKSYTGLAALRLMLREWNEDRDGPILVVCYSNHAVDAFLKELVDAEPDTFRLPPLREDGTDPAAHGTRYVHNLLRVGFRSKDEDISRRLVGKLGHAKTSGAFYSARSALCAVQRQAQDLGHVPSADVVGEIVQKSILDKQRQLQQAVDQCGRAHEAVARECESLRDTLKALTPKSPEAIALTNDLRAMEAAEGAAQATAQQALHAYAQLLAEWIKDGPSEGHGAARRPQEPAAMENEFVGEEDDDRDERMADYDDAGFGERASGGSAQPRLLDLPTSVARPAILDVPGRPAARLTRGEREVIVAYAMGVRLREFAPSIQLRVANFNREAVRFEAECQDAQRNILRRARVIGGTTSGIAKYLSLLQTLNVTTVIVEEAAEISELHAQAALLPHVQHYIQIGDHQQLRPKFENMEFSQLNLHVSMMERMVRCRLAQVTLDVQRRMRKEIADLVRPLYLDKVQLIDHDKTKLYPADARHHGVSDDGGWVRFVKHNGAEREDTGMKSVMNETEAALAAQIAIHVARQRVNGASGVTVITPYAAQCVRILSEIRNRSKLLPHDARLRVAVVDDFQGEENDVIVLSLVRTERLGFLKEVERICVALSRARHLLVVVGNFVRIKQLLQSDPKARNTYWSQVLAMAEKSGALRFDTPAGEVLQCRRHGTLSLLAPGARLEAVSPLGGCCASCGGRRACGHMCERLCHTDACEAEPCKKPCNRRGKDAAADRTCDHPCAKKCFEPCGQCHTLVTKTFPQCGHTGQYPCHVDERDSRHCKTAVLKTLPTCHHRRKVECGVDLTTVRCKEVCGVTHAGCNHPCKQPCHTCVRDQKPPRPGAPARPPAVLRHARPCTEPCGRSLVCGHLCEEPCSNICPPCAQKCPTECPHSACQHDHCGDPCVPCAEPCTLRCPHGTCGRRCGDECDREPCDEPCGEELDCGHACRGLCGERCVRCLDCNPIDEADDVFGVLDGNGNIADETMRFIELPSCGHRFAAEDLDTHIDHQVAAGRVQPFTCPQCKTPIQQYDVPRYHNTMVRLFRTVQAAKIKVVEQADEVKRQLEQAKARLQTLEQRSGALPTELARISRAICAELRQHDAFASQVRNLQWDLDLVSRFRLVDQVVHAVYLPMRDLVWQNPRHAAALDAICAKLAAAMAAGASHEDRDVALVDILLQALATACPQTAARVRGEIERLTRCKEKVAVLTRALEQFADLTTLRQIRDAMEASGQVARGAWYTCRNGHIYAIGDCGGAAQRARCPECGSPIGGEGHRVDESNRHADAFAGGTQEAWGAGLGRPPRPR
jgi:hypothetical protein